MKIIKKNQKLLSSFADHSPVNHSHRVLLIKAELARYRKKYTVAILNYDLSIKKAAENGFIQDEALASECTGEFYFERKKELYAKAYISHAYDCYLKWGALRKLQNLKEKYPFLPDIINSKNSTENIAKTVSDTLFGHRKGAYTGAMESRQDLIQQAKGGTILLDEIGDLSKESQIKLLRLIDNGEYHF